MLDTSTDLLRDLLINQRRMLTSHTQVRFQPPEEDWRTYLTNLRDNPLTVYIVLECSRKARRGGTHFQLLGTFV